MLTKIVASHTTKIDTLTTSMTEFKNRYGTGEADPTMRVRQKENPMDRNDFKHLVIEDKDIVKVNIIFVLHVCTCICCTVILFIDYF